MNHSKLLHSLWFWIVLYLLAILLPIFFGWSIIRIDDATAFQTLQNNSPYVNILSPWANYVLVYLYSQVTFIPWYSVFLAIFLILSAVLYVITINSFFKVNYKKIQTNLNLLVLYLVGIVLSVFIVLNVTITSITIFLLLTSTILASQRKLYSIAVIFIFATMLLRESVVVGLIPVIGLVIFLFSTKFPVTKTILVVVGILLLFLSGKQFSSPEYEKWIEWNGVLVQYLEYRNEVQGDRIVDTAVSEWWLFDNELTNQDKLSQQSISFLPSIYKKIKSGFLFSDIKNKPLNLVFSIFMSLVIVLMGFVIAYKKKSLLILLYSLGIFGYLYLLFSLRSVSRVNIPLLLMLFATMLLAYSIYIKQYILKVSSFWLLTPALIVFFSLVAFVNKKQIVKAEICHKAAEEIRIFKKKNPKAMIMTRMTFPFSPSKNDCTFDTLKFFHSEKIFSPDKVGILAAYVIRNPMYNKHYQIKDPESHEEFYKLLTSGNLYFVGFGEINSNNHQILDFYNRKYPKYSHVVNLYKEIDGLKFVTIKKLYILNNETKQTNRKTSL